MRNYAIDALIIVVAFLLGIIFYIPSLAVRNPR